MALAIMYLKLKTNIHTCHNGFLFFFQSNCIATTDLHREITAQKTARKGNLCKNIKSEGKHSNEQYMHRILHEK